MRCPDCGLHYLEDLKKSRQDVYGENYSVWGKDEKSIENIVAESKKQNFRMLLSQLRKRTTFKGKSILDIGTGNGYLLEVAKEVGFAECYGIELSKTAARIAEKKFPGKIFNCGISQLKTARKFDVITMTDVLEHLPNIADDFSKVKGLLKKGGHIIVTTPNTGSITQRISGKKWYQYKFEHVVYFNKKSIRHLFRQNGMKLIALENNTKSLKLAYYKAYMKKYVSRWAAGMIPDIAGRISIRNPFLGEIMAIAVRRR